MNYEAQTRDPGEPTSTHDKARVAVGEVIWHVGERTEEWTDEDGVDHVKESVYCVANLGSSYDLIVGEFDLFEPIGGTSVVVDDNGSPFETIGEIKETIEREIGTDVEIKYWPYGVDRSVVS